MEEKWKLSLLLAYLLGHAQRFYLWIGTQLEFNIVQCTTQVQIYYIHLFLRYATFCFYFSVVCIYFGSILFMLKRELLVVFHVLKKVTNNCCIWCFFTAYKATLQHIIQITDNPATLKWNNKLKGNSTL